jgi:hypothetical protein
MSFVYDLADTRYKTQVFYQSGAWVKPQGITMVAITAIGAGGGGGGGETLALGSARFGGGGGGSGAITRLIIPEMFITDSLNVVVGRGGTGGTSGGGSGTNGSPTYVDMSVADRDNIFSRVITASGGTGTARNAGAGGVVADVTQSLYSTLGVWIATAGQPGTAGLTTNAVAVVYGGTVGVPVTGGAGGGGMALNSTTASSGGNITGDGFVSTNPGGVGNTASSGGTIGVYSLTPFYSTGGSGGGGGGTTPISGGRGGDGNIGSGGGGGGAGTTPTGAGGVGGRGGDGLVIIQCW